MSEIINELRVTVAQKKFEILSVSVEDILDAIEKLEQAIESKPEIVPERSAYLFQLAKHAKRVFYDLTNQAPNLHR